ncbi:hypothetical protein CFP56_007371 [Quercus suber]|uniref:PB1-like domain-containing protein n=1 Tax=Quercus suber TaxID=58331 RepID=A0AAW0L568_QUESU
MGASLQSFVGFDSAHMISRSSIYNVKLKCAELLIYKLEMIQMTFEIRFDFTIHHSENFEWNLGLEYVGGEVSTMGNVDLDLLSHFEIQDICVEIGGPINSRIYYLIPGADLEQELRLITSDDDMTYICELHAKWPTNKITLYVEPEVEPIAIEEPIVEPDQPIAVDQP